MTTNNMIDCPMPFPGTAEELAENRFSHVFSDGRCEGCDCRPWGIVAQWECGATVPRVQMTMVEYANQLAF